MEELGPQEERTVVITTPDGQVFTYVAASIAEAVGLENLITKAQKAGKKFKAVRLGTEIPAPDIESVTTGITTGILQEEPLFTLKRKRGRPKKGEQVKKRKKLYSECTDETPTVSKPRSTIIGYDESIGGIGLITLEEFAVEAQTIYEKKLVAFFINNEFFGTVPENALSKKLKNSIQYARVNYEVTTYVTGPYACLPYLNFKIYDPYFPSKLSNSNANYLIYMAITRKMLYDSYTVQELWTALVSVLTFGYTDLPEVIVKTLIPKVDGSNLMDSIAVFGNHDLKNFINRPYMNDLRNSFLSILWEDFQLPSAAPEELIVTLDMYMNLLLQSLINGTITPSKWVRAQSALKLINDAWNQSAQYGLQRKPVQQVSDPELTGETLFPIEFAKACAVDNDQYEDKWENLVRQAYNIQWPNESTKTFMGNSIVFLLQNMKSICGQITNAQHREIIVSMYVTAYYIMINWSKNLPYPIRE